MSIQDRNVSVVDLTMEEGIIIIHDSYKAHISYQLDQGAVHYYPCSSGAEIIPETISAPWGVYSSIAAISWREAIMVNVLLKDTSTMVEARIRTHILTTQSSEHKSNALNRSTVALHKKKTYLTTQYCAKTCVYCMFHFTQTLWVRLILDILSCSTCAHMWHTYCLWCLLDVCCIIPTLH